MAKAMWSGLISFGMVSIPVKLFTATESHNVSFHLLHKKCDTRIKELRFCEHCDKQVDWDEIVKGYEYAKDQYVELTSEDFEKLPLPSKNTIDVSTFVNDSEIDPIFYDSTYYISVEEKGSLKPYKLLIDVMESKNVAGIARIAFRNKERLCALRPVKGQLCLQTLLYEDEIKKNDTAKPMSVKVSPQEKKMAESLVDALMGDFEPAKFKDKYQVALKKLIQAKLKGVEIKETKVQKPTAVADLMEKLRASVERAHHSSRPKRASKETRTKTKKSLVSAKSSKAKSKRKRAA